MQWILWPILALALLLLWLALGWVAFAVFCKTPRGFDAASEEKVRSECGPYAEGILEGQAWIRAQQPETVRTTSFDGLALVGHWLPCENARGVGILFHGYHGAWNFDFSASIPYYHSLGFSILAVEQRGQGQSGGRYMTYGVKESRDVLSWVEYVNKRFGEGTPIWIGGLSMGSATVQMASGLSLPKNVRAVCSDCGCTEPYEIAKHVLTRHHLPWWLFMPQLALFCRVFAGFGLHENSTVTAQAKNRIPTFFVHGGADTFVPTEMSQRNFDACQAEKQLLIIPGATHGVSYLVDRPRYEKEIAAFLDRYF